MFQSVSGYDYGTVQSTVERVLSLVKNNLLRVHLLSVQAASSVWVSPLTLALPKQDIPRRLVEILNFLLPGLMHTSKSFSGRRCGSESD